jgi:hypothetical protein
VANPETVFIETVVGPQFLVDPAFAPVALRSWIVAPVSTLTRYPNASYASFPPTEYHWKDTESALVR